MFHKTTLGFSYSFFFIFNVHGYWDALDLPELIRSQFLAQFKYFLAENCDRNYDIPRRIQFH